MSGELQWLLGVSVSVLLATAGMLIAAFRALSAKIDSSNAEQTELIKDGDDKLHERINRVRDEYVKRIDLDGHLGRIDQTLREMRDEWREMNRTIIASLPKQNGRS